MPEQALDDVEIRPARPEEAAMLGELALQSKAHWGYDQAFLEACRIELMFAPGDVERKRIHVACRAERVLGFYSLDGDAPHGEIGNMWLISEVIGSGLGRRLWQHAIARAGALGFTVLRIGAEPYAEGFYLAMGARRIGESPSGSIAGRVLPLLQFRLAD